MIQFTTKTFALINKNVFWTQQKDLSTKQSKQWNKFFFNAIEGATEKGMQIYYNSHDSKWAKYI